MADTYKKKLKVLMVFDTPLAYDRGHDYAEEFADAENYGA